MVSWSDLGHDPLKHIAERIADRKDLLCFGAVCKEWRSVMLGNAHRLPPTLPLGATVPLLMLCDYDENDTGILDLVSVSNQQIICRGIKSPEIFGKWVVGSFDGWIVTVEVAGRQIHVLNPLTRAQVPLPSLDGFKPPNGDFDCDPPDIRFVNKVVVFSSSETNGRRSGFELCDDCIVVSIISHSRVLSVCKSGDETWNNVEGSPLYLMDILPYKGKIYGVTRYGSLITCDVAGDLKFTLVASATAALDRWLGSRCRMRYLVETANGDLLQIARFVVSEEDETLVTGRICDDGSVCRVVRTTTVGFSVYKLVALDEPRSSSSAAENQTSYSFRILGDQVVEQETISYEWVKLDSLDSDDEVLFLGINRSLSLPASSYGPAGCKGNCIYFTDDDHSANHRYTAVCKSEGTTPYNVQPPNKWKDDKYEMGVYDIAADKILPFGEIDDIHFPLPPLWVVPQPMIDNRS